ncbi:hypothetical protein Y032_0006g2990 [Ancylostoma ceylanicum]|uniref:Uncharacterized protein n=1 Tax=Ancylostoma ceylanicum TaxID=53326 RepID=A0A016VRR6_9BILA|nr:hypothetical protein Y032_0006g2990 [Ancylostoma ceylanicum]
MNHYCLNLEDNISGSVSRIPRLRWRSWQSLRPPVVVAIATTAGGRHMDKANEETPDERGMIIKEARQSIGILPIIAITHIATSLWALSREYVRLAPFGSVPGDPRGNRYVSFPRS